MAAHLYPRTIHFDAATGADIVNAQLKQNNFTFPLIGKPDTGGRGRGVKLLENEIECAAYVNRSAVNFHIQEFIPYKNETGIFYYRFPCEKLGHISGIVRKEFLTVTGDGSSTIKDLLMSNNRSLLQMESLQNIYGDYLLTILSAGVEKLLVPYGNHARGAGFFDDTHLIDDKLVDAVNKICKDIDEFYFGRLDIKYDNWEDFKNGKNFCVIEVNGAGAEPTHIYDPRHSIFYAWREIVRHWFILNKISISNHSKGARYLTVKEGLKMFRQDKEHSQKLRMMPE
ncbi:MAG TPA: hypothetical protein VM101_12740 [Flavitalea sp.]|nr:hypothetical protein [Flavitalea sp.]